MVWIKSGTTASYHNWSHQLGTGQSFMESTVLWFPWKFASAELVASDQGPIVLIGIPTYAYINGQVFNHATYDIHVHVIIFLLVSTQVNFLNSCQTSWLLIYPTLMPIHVHWLYKCMSSKASHEWPLQPQCVLKTVDKLPSLNFTSLSSFERQICSLQVEATGYTEVEPVFAAALVTELNLPAPSPFFAVCCLEGRERFILL